jgi:predicted dienelactone hydrolase
MIPEPSEPVEDHRPALGQVRRRLRRPLLAGLLALLLLPLQAAQVAAEPSATQAAPNRLQLAVQAVEQTAASADYSVTDLEWLDVRRDRPVPARLYLPATADASQPVPLVVFSHGIGGSRNGYRYLGQYWAGQGVASLHLQHVGSDRSLWFGNPFGLLSRLQDAAQDAEAIARVQDLRFALDQLFAGPLAPRLDAGRIVAAGHSYGANTALLAVGARVERGGRTIDLRDDRLKAAIVLSAPPFYGESDFAAILGGITVPTLHVTATEDTIRIPGYYSGASDRIKVFDAVAGPRKALAVFAGGSHSMFTDRAGTGGFTLNPQVKAATRALSLAFLRSVFDGDDEALLRWPDRFAEILSRFKLSGT